MSLPNLIMMINMMGTVFHISMKSVKKENKLLILIKEIKKRCVSINWLLTVTRCDHRRSNPHVGQSHLVGVMSNFPSLHHRRGAHAVISGLQYGDLLLYNRTRISDESGKTYYKYEQLFLIEKDRIVSLVVF